MISKARPTMDIAPINYEPPSYNLDANAITRTDYRRTRRMVCIHIVGHYGNGLSQNECVVTLHPSTALFAALTLARASIAALLMCWLKK